MENQEFIMMNKVTPIQYLRQMLTLYPYDIEEALVFSLLQEDGKEHPALLSFIEFMRHIQKYHLYCKKQEIDNLHPLFSYICTLSQRNKMVLHTHQFQFHASLRIANYPIHNPYGHIPLNDVAFIDRIYIHHSLTLTMPSNTSRIPLQKSEHFIFSSISMNAFDYVALSIQIKDNYGILYIPKNQLGLVCACASLYQISKPKTNNHFIILCGIASETKTNKYYYDATNEMYIGLIRGDKHIHMDDIRLLITTIYTQICLKKDDYLLQASMLSIHLPQQLVGICICGDDNSGKSEFVEELLRYCEQHDISYDKISSNQTTLHYVDHTICATGCEIGAYKRANTLYETLYKHVSSSVSLVEEDRLTHLIVPFTTFEKTISFQPIHYCIFMNASKLSGYQVLESLQIAKQEFSTYPNPTLFSFFLERMFLNHVEVAFLTTQTRKHAANYKEGRYVKQLLDHIIDKQRF